MGQANAKKVASNKSPTVLVFDQLASVKFAASVVIVIAIACIVGTLLPQGTDAARYLRQHPEAAARMDFLGKVGLTHVFSAWWFIGLLCVVSASVAVCSTRRFATVRRTTGFARGRAFGSMITHISFLLILAGGVIRGVWGQKGYLELREGQSVAQFVEERGPRPLPFAVHLTKFEIETYDQRPAEQLLVNWPAKNRQSALPVKLGVEQTFEDFKITVLKYIPDFTVDMQTREVTSRSNEPRNPAILVAVAGPTYQNHRWLFAKFPDFDHGADKSPLQMVYAATRADGLIKSFKSTVRLIDGDAVVGERTLEVNRPLSFKGYTLYQSGYNPNDLAYTSLQVVNDPGIPVVYAGFSLMIIGLFIVFYLNPWLSTRRQKA